jgi:hypothetical protein
MHREKLLNLLLSYKTTYPEEQKYLSQMLEFLNENEQAFERSLKKGHFTASSMLLNKDATAALLMHHAKLDRWFQLGGHADGETDLLAVSIKEATEESGISKIKPVMESIFDLDIHEIPANSREEAHLHYDVRFLLQVDGDEDFRKNHESKELRWIYKNDQLPTNELSVSRMFIKWRSFNL